MRDHALEAVGPERTALAALVPVGREHEMLHHELAAAFEQIGQRHLARRPVEHIGRVDLDPGQRAPLLVEPVARFGEFLFAVEMGLARGDPFLARDDLVRLHGRLLC